VSDYLVINAGGFERRAAISVSAGAADAGKIAKTASNGLFDNSLVNWASPGAIGGTTPAAGNFTTIALGSPTALVSQEVLKVNHPTETRFQLQRAGVNHSMANCQSSGLQFGTQGALPLDLLTNGTPRLRVNSVGRVTIGTITDDGSNLLQVGGGIRAASMQTGLGAAASAVHYLDAAAGYIRGLYFRSTGSLRWTAWATNDAESGSNSGSTFEIAAYSDTGTNIDTPVQIPRAAGATFLINRPISGSSTIKSGSYTVGTLPTASTLGRTVVATDARWSGGVGCQVVDTGTYWATPDGCQASTTGYLTVVTGNTTLNKTHYTVLGNSALSLTITLPSAAAETFRLYHIKNINTGTLTITAAGSDTIDGTASKSLTQNQALTIQSDGTAWRIL
jgi:hypothetical protein